MKESFERITAWVKTHPWPSAGILALVVIAAWWSYKNGWFSGGGSGAGTTAPVDTSGGALPVADTSSLTGGGVGAGPVFDTNPIPAPTPITTGDGSSGGGSFTLPPSDNLNNLFGGPVSIATAPATGEIGGFNKTNPLSAGAAIASPSMIAATGSAQVSSGGWYDYRDPFTYNLPHNPNGSGRPPKGWTSDAIPTKAQTWIYNPTVAPNPVQQQAFIQQGGYGSSSVTTIASIQAAKTGQPAVMHGH